MLAGLLVAAAMGSATLADAVRLQRAAEVAGDVTLGDVAELSGPAALSLADLPLLTWREGQARSEVTMAQIERLLADKPVNMATLTLAGYARCEVTRQVETVTATDDAASLENASPAQSNDSASLEAQVMPVIQKLAGVESERLRVVFAANDDELLARNVAGLRVEVEPQASRLPGRLPLTIRLYEGDVVRETVRLTADVAVRHQAVVMTRGVSRGVTLTEHDVQAKEVFLTSPGEPMTDPAAVAGMMTRGALRSGNVVMAHDVNAALMVKRHDLISVRCLVGGLVVTIVGRAEEDGSDQQIITVRNEKSRQELRARVAGPGQAVMVIEDDSQSTQGATP